MNEITLLVELPCVWWMRIEKSSAVMRMESEEAREERRRNERRKTKKMKMKDGRAWRPQDQAVSSVLGFSWLPLHVRTICSLPKPARARKYGLIPLIDTRSGVSCTLLKPLIRGSSSYATCSHRRAPASGFSCSTEVQLCENTISSPQKTESHYTPIHKPSLAAPPCSLIRPTSE